MGNAINVDTDRLQEKIDKLRQLHNKLREAEEIRKPDKIGGGNTIEKLEDLSTLYSEICNALKELLTNSEDYFIKVKDSTIQTNRKTSSAILGK